MKRHVVGVWAVIVLAACVVWAADPVRIDLSGMRRIGQVSERYVSYNVEMVEVTGGRFWAPYRTDAAPAEPDTQNAPVAGLDPRAFRQRPAADLANTKLRGLAAALGPADLRVSGTWANAVYFHDADSPAPASPPTGFNGVLTRAQWRGVVDFAKAVGADLVTSFAISEGTRRANGTWTPDQAQKLLAFTASIGGRIAAAEFFNEPNVADRGNAPRGNDTLRAARQHRGPGHGRGSALRGVALAHGARRPLLRGASRPVRTRPAAVAHRDH